MSLKGITNGGALRGTVNKLTVIHGYSAYELAVIHGFEGTEKEWLASLKGEKGENGENGHTPVNGVDYNTPEEKAAVTSAVDELATSQKKLVFGGDFSGSVYKQISCNIPVGSYEFHIDSFESTDTDQEKSVIQFRNNGTAYKLLSLDRNTPIDQVIEFTLPIDAIYIYASKSYNESVGDEFSVNGLKILCDTELKKKLSNIEDSLNKKVEPIATRNLMTLTFANALIDTNNGIYQPRTDGYKSAASEVYLAVTSGETYTLSWASVPRGVRLYVHQYTSDKVFINSQEIITNDKVSSSVTLDTSCSFVRIGAYLNNTTTPWQDIVPTEFQFELGAEATAYIPPKIIDPSIIYVEGDDTNEKNNSAIVPFPVGFNMISYSQLWSFAPINTVPNYETAGFLGFDMIKGDVRITSDNVLVMCHDAGFTFDDNGRITTYSASNSTPIREMTAEQVLALEHKAYIEIFGSPVHPCTIDDYLRVCSKWQKIPFVTIRDEYMEDIAPILVEKLKYWHFEDTAIINSFTAESLLAVRELLPRIWLHLVNGFQSTISLGAVDFCIKNFPCALGIFNYGVSDDPDNFTDAMLNEAVVAKCKENRIPVVGAIAYTKKQIEHMRSLGYSGTQSQYIAPEFSPKKYSIHIVYTDGAWAFKHSQLWEYDGSIATSDDTVYVKCNDIVPTWLHYLSPTITAKCTTDTSITVNASSVSWGTYAGCVSLTPSSVKEGMEIDIRIEF